MLVSVSNLRINNTAASGTVKVTDPYPTLNWEYDLAARAAVSANSSSVGVVTGTNTAATGGYEIRISDSTGSHGTDSFIGYLMETGFVASDQLFWRYRGPRLERGTTYYGQIRLTDAYGNDSDWATFAFQYNSLPTVNGATITPEEPTINDDLVLSYTFDDDDGDSESGTKVWWFRNGVHERQYDDRTVIESKFLVYADEWSAQVFPSDGYEIGTVATTDSVTITKDTPVASDLRIEPSDPTTADPLYAVYSFSGSNDESQLRWYVNNALQTATTAFARLDLEPGDVVRFEVKPSDGEIEGSWQASSNVTIAKAPLRVTNIVIDSQREPINLGSLTPTISWSVVSQDRQHNKVSVRIGTAPGAYNIYDEEVLLGSTLFVVPEGLLENGLDYYISLAAGDEDGYGDYSTAHFRTTGSRWQMAVSNSTGWTVESTVKISASDDRPASSSSSSSSADSSSSSSGSTVVPSKTNVDSLYYQGYRIYDGTKFAEIRLYEDSIIFISDTISEALIDLTSYNVLTVTGQGSNIKIYVNYQLVLDGTGLLTKTSTDKLIEFGAIGESEYTDGEFINFFYTCEGAFEPATSEKYYDVQYEDFYETDGTIDFVTGVPGGDGYYSVSSDDNAESSVIYKVADYIQPTVLTPTSDSLLSVNRIAQDPENKYTYVCHEAGITGMKSYLIPTYDSDLDFTAAEDPVGDFYNLVSTNASPQFVVSGLKINTQNTSGKLYYTQNAPGTKWFDNVSNEGGWTVSFSILSGAETLQDISASNTATPDGAGIYINDGTYWENVYFFPQEIVFMGRQLTVPFDTTSIKEYVITGERESIKLFAKAPSANTFTLIAETKLVNRATFEANGTRPAVVESDGISHAVWQDDGTKFKQIYYSSLDNDTTKWTNPRVIVNEKFGASNPSIAIDSHGTIYVAYESHRSDGTDIGLVVKNRYGWSKPFTVSTDPFSGLHPKIAVDDDDNVHLVWEDHRNNVSAILYVKRTYTTGNWSSAEVLTEGANPCVHPALALHDGDVFVSYTKQAGSGLTDIYVIKHNGASWGTEKNVSVTGVTADYSDILVRGSVVFVAWHDHQNDDFEVFSRRLNTANLNYVAAVEKLTSDLVGSRFPALGVQTGATAFEDNVYCVFESGGDLSPYDGDTFTATDTQIKVCVFDNGLTAWKSSNLTGGFDTTFTTPDTRYSRRPAIARHFEADAHILYESDLTTSADEYIATSDEFTSIRDAVYDLTYAATYSLNTAEEDLKVSGQLPRREIRFGDFSDLRNHNYTFGYFRHYAKDAVEPFAMWLLPAEALAMDASPNQNGDAWLAFNDRLLFYFRNSAELARSATEIDKPQRIRFDGKNKMYVLNNATDSEIFVSEDHVTFTTWGTGTNVIDMDFAPDGHLWLATTTHVIEYITEPKTVVSQYPIDGTISRIAIDPQGIVWIGTDAGLVSIHKGQLSTFDPDNSGLLDANVRDIAIRNSGTRYLATPAGLIKMVGNTFHKITIEDSEWSEDLSVVSWKEPNVIWAAGNSKLFQLLVDELDDSYQVISFNAQSFANYTEEAGCGDAVNYSISEEVDDNTLVQLAVNGRIVKHGYRIKGTKLRLDAPLKASDEIQLIIRKDVTKYASLEQNEAEVIHNGTIERRLKKFLVDGERVYGATEGDKKQVVVYNQGDTYELPYDKIVLDTEAPTGFLVFEKQLTSRTVQLFIDEATDNLSGLAEMAIANHANLTSDGETPVEWQPFKERFEFDIGTDFGNQTTELVFDEYTGVGKRLGKFNGNVYAGTESPAMLYRLDTVTANSEFEEVFDFPDEPSDTSVEFILPFLQTLIIGTGSPSGQAKLWTTTDGTTYKLLQVLSGTHALCATILNGVYYVGTQGGPLYKISYSGSSASPLRVESTGVTLGNAIYSLYGAKDFIWAGTAGKVYKINTDVNAANASQNAYTPQFLHTEQDSSISAIAAGDFNPVTASSSQPPKDFLVFAAGGTNGRIVKSINGNPFGPSLQTISTPITQLKFNGDRVLHACVGRNLYKYGSKRSWDPVVTHTEEIFDVEFDQKGVWLMGESGIRRVLFETAKKKIYFALRDVAGNATADPGETTAVADFEEIDIDDLAGFVNQNRILELDEYGAEVFRYTGTGDTPFYSADKVEVERAEYYSEIFNGTTDHVTWDIIYWDAFVPEGTDFNIQVRAGLTKDDLLASRFTKTFTKEEFEGGDITSLSGQYLQFKVIMTTEVRGKSPKLYRVNVRGLTRSAVHFFTTNFILPSKMNKGIITANTVIPVAADIVVGVDTNDSTDFSTYQPIELNRLFTLGPDQTGLNLRIGIKLISPLQVVNQTTDLEEYDEYGLATYNNVIEFSYTADEDANYGFAVQFYTDADMTDLATTLYTGTTPSAWSVDGAEMEAEGIELQDGDTVKVIAGVKGNAAIRCNQFYYVKLLASKDNGALVEFDSGLPFVSGCHPNFVDYLEFPFVNMGATGNFHFRAKFYSNVTRTELVQTFYSGLDQSGWTVNGANIGVSGFPVTSGNDVTVGFLAEGLDAGVYYLAVDAFNGSEFETVSNSYYIRITDSDETYCGEYMNVPIVKDLVAMIEIDDFLEKFGTSEKLRRTVLLNQQNQ